MRVSTQDIDNAYGLGYAESRLCQRQYHSHRYPVVYLVVDFIQNLYD